MQEFYQFIELGLAIVTWSLLCSIDGCMVASATFGSTHKINPLRWGAYIGMGHFFCGTIGVIVTATAATLLAAWFGYALAAVAIAYVLLHLVKNLNGAHEHESIPQGRMLILVAIGLSGDALLQGAGIEGHFLHHGEDHTSVVVQLGVLGALISTAVIASLVGVLTWAATSGVNRASDQLKWFQRYLPMIGVVLLSGILMLMLWRMCNALV